MTFNSSFYNKHCLPSQAPQFPAVQRLGEEPLPALQPLKLQASTETLPFQPSVQAPAIDIWMIGTDAFHFFTQRPGMQILSRSVFTTHKALNTKHSKSDIQIALDRKSTINPLTKLPPEYHDYADVFLVAESDKLPPHRSYYHKIQLESEEIPDHGPIDWMSRDELLVLKKYLEDNLHKRFIRTSTSSTASSVLFVKKTEGGLRFCVDYRKRNAITVKDKYPVPMIQDTLN